MTQKKSDKDKKPPTPPACPSEECDHDGTARWLGKEVYRAIAAVQGDLAKIGIGKTDRNQQQGFMYRGIDAVYGALAPLLAEHGLCILPRAISREMTERQSKKGGALYSVVMAVEFDFVSTKDSSVHTVKTFAEAMDSADKATNKAMSSAYKYAAFQAFCIPIEAHDPDNDSPEPEPEPEPEPQQPSSPESPPETDPNILTTDQRKGVFARLNAIPVPDDQKLVVLSDILGHEVTSTKTLTKHEASTIIGHLLEPKNVKSIKEYLVNLNTPPADGDLPF